MSTEQTLLVVGPQPPPLGGATISVQVLLEELARQHTTVHPIVVNTSPRANRKVTKLAEVDTLARVVRIVRQYRRSLENADAVLMFATSRFIFTGGYLLLLMARQRRVPVYLKPLGADLGAYLASRRGAVQARMLAILRSASGVLVQTRQLHAELLRLGCTNAHYVPGYRPAPQPMARPQRSRDEFRLLFLSQVMVEKGPLLLLDALRDLAGRTGVAVTCDFYGPIMEQDREAFLRQVATAPGASYCGVAEGGTASHLMTGYDALVFPTHFDGEGHPGVIIEAMQSGIPVISTQHQAIPELITDGENGLLVPVKDPAALAGAIGRLALDPLLREQMGQANYRRGQEFRSDLVVPRMLEIVLPGFAGPAVQAKGFGEQQMRILDRVACK